MGAAQPSFCQSASAMSHYGFHEPTDFNPALEFQCAVFLFNQVVDHAVVPYALDNPTKYFFGTVGVLLMAVLAQSFVWARRRAATKIQRPALAAAAMALFYALQVLTGYFLMLISMTYQVPLFVAIILGLAIGHICFNYDPADEPASAAPAKCC